MKTAIKLNEIDKIEIYQNTKRYYKEKIKSITGCDYIINGAFFSNSYKPLQTLKVNGKLIVKDPIYNNIKENGYLGYGWNNAGDICLTRWYESFQNFICCINGLQDGENRTMYYNPDVAGSRPRTAIGLTKDSLVLYCDKSKKTPEQVRDILKSMGCISCVVLDGGGSTQGNFNGEKVNSSENNGNGRICYSYILVYLKKDSQTDIPTKPNIINPYTIPVTTLRKGNTGSGVKWLQYQLNAKGHDCGTVDGIFGNGTYNAVVKFQRDKGLSVDGIVGKMTRECLVN